MGELLFMGSTAVVALGMLVMTVGFPVSIIDNSGGPALFPRIIIVLLIAFMLIRAVIVLKDKDLKNAPFIFSEMFKGARLIYLLGTLSYILLIKKVGFVIMTTLYLFGMTLFLHYLQRDRHFPWKKTLIVLAGSISIAVGIYLIFTGTLNTLLPKGVLKWI
jgi:putative tricarboxylic transport membrane protein